MAIIDEIKKPKNRIYADVYLKRRYPDGSFDADWIGISRYVIGTAIDRIRYSLDSGDFDVGIFVTNSVRLAFDNRSGKFNDIDDSRSLWAAVETRHLSKIKIEAGYIDSNDAKLEAIPFNGVFDDKSVRLDDKDRLTAVILSIDSVFGRVDVPAGSLSSSITATEAVYTLCNRAEITDYLTVDSANLAASNDIVIDNPNDFDGRKLDSVLGEIMLLSNSVIYVDENGALRMRTRQHTALKKYSFYKNSESGYRDNIYSIKSINNGRQRVKNSWYWSGTSVSSRSEERHLNRYGVTRKSISSSAISSAATKQSILDNLLTEWQFPKQEFEIETDYMPNVLQFYETVSCDVRPRLARETDLPVAGKAVAGEALAVDYINGLYVSPLRGFKILAIEHDLNAAKTIFKLRNIGNQLNDGYLSMAASKTYTVTFTSSTSEDIDTSGAGLNAQRCKVEVLDTATSFKTELITVTRPDTNTIRLTAGSAISKTFRVLVVETEA